MKRILLFLCLVNSAFILAQESFLKQVVESIQKEALLREKVFIHTNKTTYFSNENIWFTAYVVEDKDNIPSNFTTNLRVNLLNELGEIMEQKNVFVKNGIGFGDFQLSSNKNSGKFYIQAFTNYMQNFGKENFFIQEIEFINTNNSKTVVQNQTTVNYDIQVFPESGYLLTGAENTVGIKALINGKGQVFSGSIKNSQGVEVATIYGNLFGMGKFNFTPKKNESYTAIISINNSIQSVKLPKANNEGIIFGLDNLALDKLKITLKTNIETLQKIKNDSLTLLFYQNNNISQAVNLTLKNTEQTQQDVFFDKSKMFYGVNTVTLFRNNQPIAERKFFVDNFNKQTALLIEELNRDKDTIAYKIETYDANYKAIASQLSIAILTEDSKAYKEDQHIKSAFLLSPYVKGYIETPAFYFANKDAKASEFLDVLLLNQGWSNYSLEKKIEEINPIEKHEFQQGFTLKGKIGKYPKGYDLGILSKANKFVAISTITNNKEFLFENIFAFKNDEINMALTKKNASLIKPIGLAFDNPKQENENYSAYLNLYYKNKSFSNDAMSNDKTQNELNFEQYPKIILLDEVVMQTKVQKKVEKSIKDVEMELANNRNLISSSAYQGKKVTQQMETNNQTVFDYFRGLNYLKQSPSGAVDSYFLSLRSGPATIIDYGGTANPDGTFPPKVYINDALYSRSDNVKILQDLNMRDVDEILVNKTGAGGGIDGTGGMIRIYLKKANHQYFGEESKNLYDKLLLETGFDRAKEYYKPEYSITSEKAFNWTEIDWKPNVQTDDNGTIIIKIPTNSFTNNFQFVINGIAKNGLLFHDIYKTSSSGF